MMGKETRKVQTYQQLIRKRADKEGQRLNHYHQEEEKVCLVPDICLHI